MNETTLKNFASAMFVSLSGVCYACLDSSGRPTSWERVSAHTGGAKHADNVARVVRSLRADLIDMRTRGFAYLSAVNTYPSRPVTFVEGDDVA